MSKKEQPDQFRSWTKKGVKSFNRIVERYAVSDDASLKDWQLSILFLIFFYMSIVGIVPCFTSIFLTITMGHYHVAAFYLCVYILVLIITFGRSIPFKTRATIGMALFYIIGTMQLLKIGPTGNGRMYLFVFALIACLTLGFRAAVIAIFIDCVTFVGIGYLLHYGIIHWEHSPLIHVNHWTVITITFLFLSTLVIIPLSIVVSARDKRLLREISLSENLRRVNRKYKQENLERKLIEKELKESEEKFLKVFQIHPAAMAIISLEKACFIDANDTFRRIFGEREVYIGKPTDELNIWVNREERDVICKKIREESASVRNFEISVYRADRTICRVLFSADIINLKGKKLLLAVLVDIFDKSRG